MLYVIKDYLIYLSTYYNASMCYNLQLGSTKNLIIFGLNRAAIGCYTNTKYATMRIYAILLSCNTCAA